MSFPKSCGCGCIYSASAWAELEFGGIQFEDEPGESLVLRHCPAPCLSTLAVPVADDPATCSTLPPEAGDAWFAEAAKMLEAS